MSKQQIALNIAGLTKVYTNGVEAVKGIDLQVREGDFFALLGPNGAGKSTTIGVISSLVNKTKGKVEVFGCDIDTDLEAAKAHLGLVPQEFNFSQFETLTQILVTQAGYYGVPRGEAHKRAEKYLTQLGLLDKKDKQARTLSGGMKRRLMIARALMHEPKLLILDEPTAGVDIELRRSMWDFLRQINEQGVTIILTTHYLEEAELLCKNIAIIDNGLIVENTTIKALLSKLDKETFILDLKTPAKPVTLEGYKFTMD
ncbi:MAG: ABC transporter ATP-binding protein, partial [Pseudoalteromonas nigrifaciens]